MQHGDVGEERDLLLVWVRAGRKLVALQPLDQLDHVVGQDNLLARGWIDNLEVRVGGEQGDTRHTASTGCAQLSVSFPTWAPLRPALAQNEKA